MEICGYSFRDIKISFVIVFSNILLSTIVLTLNWQFFSLWYWKIIMMKNQHAYDEISAYMCWNSIICVSENKRTQKARKEKGTSLASLPSQTTHPRTLSIYWTYQCFCTIKKQVALTGNKNWFNEVKVSIGNNKSILIQQAIEPIANRTVEKDARAWTGPPHCGWQVGLEPSTQFCTFYHL